MPLDLVTSSRVNYPASMSGLMPQEIAGCRVIRELGTGALATVYLAQRKNGDRVAIKLLHRPASNEPGMIHRFEREAQLCYQIRHPHLISVHTWGQAHGRHFLLMDWVNGTTLDELVSHHRGRLDWWLVVALMHQIAQALRHVHQLGVIHRDVKPSNILISRDGNAKLGDLGLARRLRTLTDMAAGQEPSERRLTEDGAAIGSPAFMAPEQITNSAEVNFSADLYSFGATTYFACVGEPPLHDQDPMMTLRKVLDEAPQLAQAQRPDIPIQLSQLIARCLAKKPQDRPASSAEVIGILQQIVPSIT